MDCVPEYADALMRLSEEIRRKTEVKVQKQRPNRIQKKEPARKRLALLVNPGSSESQGGAEDSSCFRGRLVVLVTSSQVSC